MDIDGFNAELRRLNRIMADHDDFFADFGRLDDVVYDDGAIPKLYKELSGLSLSIATRCTDCVTYHVQGALNAGATRDQIVEAVKIGVVGGGSITYPTARHAFAVLEALHP